MQYRDVLFGFLKADLLATNQLDEVRQIVEFQSAMDGRVELARRRPDGDPRSRG